MPRFGTLTRKGRVVYDRKPHTFRWCDARRIVRSLDSSPGRDDVRQLLCFLELVDRVLDFLPLEIASKTIEIEPPEQFSAEFGRFLIETAIAEAFTEFDGFSGGNFGGGGATRDVSSGESSSAPTNINQTTNPFEIGPCGVPFIVQPIQDHCV